MRNAQRLQSILEASGGDPITDDCVLAYCEDMLQVASCVRFWHVACASCPHVCLATYARWNRACANARAVT